MERPQGKMALPTKCWLFEKRLNNEEGGEVSDLWFDIDIQCIPTKKPKDLGEWRPISLLSIMQKFYCAATARMYDDWIDLPLWMAGFSWKADNLWN